MVCAALTCVQLKPTTPAPMTASERATVGRTRLARESFMLSYEVRAAHVAVLRHAALRLAVLLRLVLHCSALFVPLPGARA